MVLILHKYSLHDLYYSCMLWMYYVFYFIVCTRWTICCNCIMYCIVCVCLCFFLAVIHGSSKMRCMFLCAVPVVTALLRCQKMGATPRSRMMERVLWWVLAIFRYSYDMTCDLMMLADGHGVSHERHEGPLSKSFLARRPSPRHWSKQSQWKDQWTSTGFEKLAKCNVGLWMYQPVANSARALFKTKEWKLSLFRCICIAGCGSMWFPDICPWCVSFIFFHSEGFEVEMSWTYPDRGRFSVAPHTKVVAAILQMTIRYNKYIWEGALFHDVPCVTRSHKPQRFPVFCRMQIKPNAQPTQLSRQVWKRWALPNVFGWPWLYGLSMSFACILVSDGYFPKLISDEVRLIKGHLSDNIITLQQSHSDNAWMTLLDFLFICIPYLRIFEASWTCFYMDPSGMHHVLCVFFGSAFFSGENQGSTLRVVIALLAFIVYRCLQLMNKI